MHSVQITAFVIDDKNYLMSVKIGETPVSRCFYGHWFCLFKEV